MNRLTKLEWEKKVKEFHANELEKPIPLNETILWWYRRSNDSGLRLEKLGFDRFVEAGVEFQKYDVEVPTWIGAITLGLSRMPCPFYIFHPEKYSLEYEFYIADDEYAMMFMFMNNNMIMFSKGFLNETV